MALLPLLCGIAEEHPDVPLLAAGGIGDGRTFAAALVAGADGAWLGTALLATPEAIEVTDEHKDAIIASDGGDTVFSSAYDIASRVPWPAGIGARMQRNAFTDEWLDREAELRRRVDELEPPPPVHYFGQSARFVAAVQPAANVVRSISERAAHVLAERPGRLVESA
jgi:nitronate monooxygenase